MVTEEKVKGKRNINKTEKSNIENLDDINFDILYEMDVSQDDLFDFANYYFCLLYTSPSPRDRSLSRLPSSA